MTQYETVVPIAFKHTDTVTCTPPWYVQHSEYHPLPSTYQALVNGEQAFRAVHRAIAAATNTIDIVCWGFQPSMYLIRDGQALCLGELLERKAAEGVRVRVLGWEMPFNAAGMAGEANLPGKGRFSPADHAGQSSTPAQYAFDQQWFKAYAVADRRAAARGADRVPLFVSRGFSLSQRNDIRRDVKQHSLDPELSTGMRTALFAAATHHQKSVMVDYEVPDRAIGFVMGHNLLDEYWDTNAHSARNRDPLGMPDPNRGARGFTPRQDISCQLGGPILEHLHHNFATAWRDETGEDLLQSRNAKTVGPLIQCNQGKPQMAQLLRTQPQAGTRDIERLYLQAVNNATQFIYIENQYFRWPPLAEAIKKAAADQTRGGRDPGVHGPLHLFVITNATDEGMGAGTVNTQRMLEALGRADTIAGVTKLRRVQTIIQEAPPKPRPEARDRAGQRELAQWEADIAAKTEEVMKATVLPEEIPGLKVHICSLVAPDSPPGQTWMPVYIHSKLMIVDDVFTTHGSANINTRSMQVDSELNIAHDWCDVTQELRRELWNMHTGGEGGQDSAEEAFASWGDLIGRNNNLMKKGGIPRASVVGFVYDKPTWKDLD